jgi:hypothetical protein
VAGAAALLLSRPGSASLTPALVESALVAASTTGLVTDQQGSPGRLRYVGQ